MGAIRKLLAFGAVVAALLLAGGQSRILGPRDPIAADGSLKAGRMLTIAELSPSAPAAPTLDDPDVFEARFYNSSIERDRGAILDLVGLLGPRLCEHDRHQQLVRALQDYYGTKKYLEAEFHFRGPRASQFIDAAWTTPKDGQIAVFVSQLLNMGYLRPHEVWPERSFFLDILAQDLGSSACSRS